MLKALLPIIGLTFAVSTAANAKYAGPMPGDMALSTDMCHEVCDITLTDRDDVRMSCHGLCDDMDACMSNHSQDTNSLNDCTSNANRKYALRLKGMGVQAAAAHAEADRAVVTDADNFRADFEEDNSKGFRDAR